MRLLRRLGALLTRIASSIGRGRRATLGWVRRHGGDLVELAGLGLVVTGVAMWSVAAAFITGGVGLIVGAGLRGFNTTEEKT